MLQGHEVAVYTDVGVEELTAFLADYDVGQLLSYKGIAEGVENSNFLVHTSASHFILTLYERRVAAKDVPFFLALMEHLHARGITCPQPVKNKAGEVLGKIARRPAALITFLDGMWIRRPTPPHCAALGDVLARLHLAGLDFGKRRANALSVDDWRSLYESCRGRANKLQRDLEQSLASELVRLEQEWPRDLPRGVIHADLFPDNVFFLGNKLSGLIDFYFACTDALAYTLRSASTPGASRPTTPTTSPRGEVCCRPMPACGLRAQRSVMHCRCSPGAQPCAFF